MHGGEDPPGAAGEQADQGAAHRLGIRAGGLEQHAGAATDAAQHHLGIRGQTTERLRPDGGLAIAPDTADRHILGQGVELLHAGSDGVPERAGLTFEYDWCVRKNPQAQAIRDYPNVSAAAWDPVAEVGAHAESRPVVAMAGGPAFTFGYAEHRELLTAAGADVQVFDPLRDELPAGTAALVLPGGFPEEHAVDLAANTVLLQQVRDLADGGAPIHAECAGLLYLARSLDGHSMAGVVGVDATFGKRLTLGYREAVAISDSSLFEAGSRVTGHEFHRTSLVSADADGCGSAWGWRPWDGGSVREGFVRGGVLQPGARQVRGPFRGRPGRSA